MNKQNTRHIDTYSLPDLLTKVQEAVLEGYRVDLTSNQNFPFSTMGRYWLTMLKGGSKEVKPVEVKVQTELVQDVAEEKPEAPVEEAPKKPGRKAKD